MQSSVSEADMVSFLERQFSVRGQVALVTGGARGIGLETALFLISAGASVAILDRDKAALQDALATIGVENGAIFAVAADVANESAIKDAFAKVLDRFGRLDILVNNAAVVRRIPATETSAAVWRDVVDVNLNAAFFASCESGGAKVGHGSGGIMLPRAE